MFKNYLKIALRNIKRQRLYSAINILGLAIGLAAAILIILFITDEINFDKFNHNYDRIARLITTSRSEDKSVRTFSLSPGIIGQRLKNEFPEIIDYTNIIDSYSWGRFTVKHGENKYYESNYLITQPSFFRLFDFKVLKGNKKTFLTEPNEMVLTESTARRLFGPENPIGKTIKTDRSWGDFKVTGIMQDPPKNSHLQFSMLISMRSLNKFSGFIKAYNSFDYDIVRTYLFFKKEYKIKNFEEKLREFQSENKTESFGVKDVVSLQKLSDIHFNSQDIEFDLNADSRSKTAVYILAVIGLLIILIAVINYTNLAAAKSMNRMKEIGIRKVIGAGKNQLIQQFLIEAIVITFVSLITSLFIAELALSHFNNFTGKSLSLINKLSFPGIAAIIILSLFTALSAGILPSLLFSKFKTIQILKGEILSEKGFSTAGKGLLIFQFALSTVMVFCTVTIYKQLQFIETKNLGFNNNNMLVVDINSSGTRKNFRTLKDLFSQNSNIKSIAVSSRIPGDWKNLDEINARNFGEDQQKDHKMFYIGADYDFISTFGISIIDGRNFHHSYTGDSADIIINREAALALGLKDPIGEKVIISDGDNTGTYNVIGLVKDFNFQSLHEKISPMIIGFWNNPFTNIDYYTARISGKNIPETIKYFADVQQKFDNITPFEYNFLDERMRDFYKQDIHEGDIINFASGLALLIACLGLFGLTAFSAEKRIKEIGVRKVLGASISGIVFLFSRDFLIIILIAALISFPLAYYLMRKWLDLFAYKTELSWWFFLFSGAVVMLIALLTVGYLSIKAAVRDPVTSLRHE